MKRQQPQKQASQVVKDVQLYTAARKIAYTSIVIHFNVSGAGTDGRSETGIEVGGEKESSESTARGTDCIERKK